MKTVPTDRPSRPGELKVPEKRCGNPKLLVSIRDRGELATVLESGVDIIDLKEPDRGPLAPADQELWFYAASVWERLGPSSSLSAALGEQTDAIQVAGRLPGQFAFAKAGPSECRTEAAVGQLWQAVGERLDDQIELVAVAYADYQPARCPPPEEIFRLAACLGRKRCLIDTFVKDGRSTIDHLGANRLASLARLARAAGLWWTLAGSIRVSCVSPLREQAVLPDCFGVRGDVCHRGRQSTLASERLAVWKNALSGGADRDPACPIPRTSPVQ